MSELRAMAERAMQFAATVFNPNDPITPMWVLETNDGQHLLVATPFRDDDEKEATAQVIREMVKEKNVIRAAFLSEAWFRTAKTKDEAMNGRVSEQPDAKECLHVFAQDGRNLVSIMRQINRDENGVTLGEPDVIEGKRDRDIRATRFGGVIPLADN